jgi:wyosine [tRNA(Phe)-imidazoG37] synthetase (radical SAM superfamily)
MNIVHSHLFGPVFSRRLGLSLGVDLIPYKSCSYNCVYCECGQTSQTTCIRREFFPPECIISELDHYLSRNPRLDTITFAGSGEPTLSASVGSILRYLKTTYPQYLTTVLTNGSLLSDSQVQEELCFADQVIPTLSTVYNTTFQKIHRPDKEISINQVIDGLIRFRRLYTGTLIIEIFIIPGLNTTTTELDGLVKILTQINPDGIQLNTLDRPAAERWVQSASLEELTMIRDYLNLPGITIAGDTIPPAHPMRSELSEADLIRSVLSRRPSTIEDLIRMTGMSESTILKIVNMLQEDKTITRRDGARGTYYCSI